MVSRRMIGGLTCVMALLAIAIVGWNVADRVQAQQQSKSAAKSFQAAQSAVTGKADKRDCHLDQLAAAAVSEDQETAEAAIAELRAAGQAGLDAMFRMHGDSISGVRKGIEESAPFQAGSWQTPEMRRLKHALDAIARQYDVHASCLYWHTDMEAAKSEAQATGKPILSLRLLGNLDEECSCANSRFFRTALYANNEVAEYLRNNFVLHWKSVRPVPKITIDFGDGRVMERTITGNSIHYVLTPDGQVVDALPGLYGPQAFMAGLQIADEFMDRLLAASQDEQAEMLRRYHVDSAAETVAQLRADLQLIAARDGYSPPDVANRPNVQAAVLEAAVVNAKDNNAARANNRTAGKMAIEAPILNAMSITEASAQANAELAGSIDKATWAKIAVLHSDEVKLDESSIGLMREHQPDAMEAAALAVSKMRVEDPMVRMVMSFERSIAEDTVRNEYLFHRQINEWFAMADDLPRDVDVLNERVYAELFLTPSNDPWLGLKQGEYSALRADGVKPMKVEDSSLEQ